MKKTLLVGAIAISLLMIGLVLISEGDATVGTAATEHQVSAAETTRPPTQVTKTPAEADPAGVEESAVELPLESGDHVRPVRFEVAAKGRIDQRERMGLPPVMKSLRQAAHYRRPTRVEQADPILMERYQLERKIHGAYWMTRHELEEAGRFQQDVERATDPAERAFLRKVASQHQALAEKNAQQHAELEEERLLVQ